MSERFPGGFITNNPTAPTTTSAPGIWTLDQATQYIKAGTWPYGGPFNYIEDVFQTWLYTGTGANQSINNGVDLSTYGGLVWNKVRGATGNTSYHYWVDTARGRAYGIGSNSTDAQYTSSAGNDLASFTTTGYTLGPKQVWNASNFSGADIVSWTFRKQPKFFDVVTWTGDGNATKTISHNLGSVPGCIMVKLTSGVNGWDVYHRSLGTSAYVQLNTTAASTTISNVWGTITSTTFTATGTLGQNDPGATYVAYLFAHNAGGFGLTGTDNVISCGSFSGAQTINLGYEPQWVLVKGSDTATNWQIEDNMRGLTSDGTGSKQLYPNLSNAEANASDIKLNATGFETTSAWAGITGIYIAIRRGPMKTPTSGTSVYEPVTYTGNGVVSRVVSYSLTPDSVISGWRSGEFIDAWANRLTNKSTLNTQTTAAELNNRIQGWDVQNGLKVGEYGEWNANTRDYINWVFKRAPGFFDEVCYTGTGGVTTISHNLGVVPELMIVKCRSAAASYWTVYSQPTGNTNYLYLDSTNASASFSAYWNNTTPTASVFTLGAGNGNDTNASGATYVAYLFASVAGVSKVGSYTGTGALQTINCGFTGGARWVMIKRTDSTGDWYVWDTARGMVSGTDPSLLLNSTAAEVNANSVYTTSVGFQIVSTAAGINASGGTYIFLAIA